MPVERAGWVFARVEGSVEHGEDLASARRSTRAASLLDRDHLQIIACHLERLGVFSATERASAPRSRCHGRWGL